MRPRWAPAVLAAALAATPWAGGCSLFFDPVFPDLGRTYLANDVEVQADPKTVDELLAAFHKADEALKRKDVEAMMALYSDGYRHRGYGKADLRAEWARLFRDYRELSGTHIFSKILAPRDATPPRAEITCTGALWGLTPSGQRENLDSWYSEVHYLEFERGAWRIRGHAWEGRRTPKESRAAPPHPLF